MAADRGYVRLPTPARVPAGYGLLSAATVQPFGSEREGLGVEFETVGCGTSMPYPLSCATPPTKVVPGGPGLVTGDPFVVVDGFECLPRDDARVIATTRLNLGAGQAVERALWSGVADSHPNFVDDAQVLSTTPLDLSDAMAVLQQAIGVNSPAGGVIHLPRGGAACLACCAALRDGNVLRDLLGHAFALGAGYDPQAAVGGTALPAGATMWMVGTGPVTVRYGPVVVTPSTGFVFDVTKNLMAVLAEQVHTVTVECGMWAVPVKDCGDLSTVTAVSVEPEQVVVGEPVTVRVVGGPFHSGSRLWVDGEEVPTTVESGQVVSAPYTAQTPGLLRVWVQDTSSGRRSGYLVLRAVEGMVPGGPVPPVVSFEGRPGE